MRVWHYTTTVALKGIFSDGEIKCDKIYLEGEIPCVWLSTNEDWEQTVRKKLRNTETGVETEALSRDGLFRAGVLPARIEIKTSRVKITDWRTHCKKIPKEVAKVLEQAAKAWGSNPDEWWVSYKPIPVKRFLSPIEIWDGKQWVKASKK